MTSGIKRSIGEISEILSSFNYSLISDYYENGKRKVIFEDCFGYKYDVRMSSLMEGESPRFVSKSNKFSLENIEKWIINNGCNYRLVGENFYDGKKTKMNVVCLSCKNVFNPSWDNMLQGRACPKCAIKRNNDLKRKSHFVFLKEVFDLYGSEYTILGEYYSCHTKIEVLHETCGTKWFIEPNAFIRGNGCPKCNSSRGEKVVSNFLKKNNIFFTEEKTFFGCVYKRNLPFDFYLPSYNLCIEYHGKQHYESVDFFGGIKSLKVQQKRDKIKEQYCKDNNIKLVIIPYWEFDNIEKVLEQTLFT